MLHVGARRAPAKINLTLEVLARRGDGLHALRSVMLPIALHDELRWEPAPALSVTYEGAQIGADDLVTRAARTLGAPAVRISVRKRIPHGAGLGGGSSDAAAVLLAAQNGALSAPAPPADWLAAAHALGSDVPFFLVEDGALIEGTGERVTPLGALPPWWVVLLMPATTVSTADAYAALDLQRAREPAGSRPRASSTSVAALVAVQRGDFAAAAAASINDFEAVVGGQPAIAEALAALRAAGAPLVRLCGSGACCFALCRDEAEAREVGARLQLPAGASTWQVPLDRQPAWR